MTLFFVLLGFGMTFACCVEAWKSVGSSSQIQPQFEFLLFQSDPDENGGLLHFSRLHLLVQPGNLHLQLYGGLSEWGLNTSLETMLREWDDLCFAKWWVLFLTLYSWYKVPNPHVATVEGAGGGNTMTPNLFRHHLSKYHYRPVRSY